MAKDGFFTFNSWGNLLEFLPCIIHQIYFFRFDLRGNLLASA
ncbi:hypothetical protein PTUN_b0329 [Pseudoalteromonas tunicata]|nr:hypothetical protein PTUN_b0329 [Pseudoalteromonas tunicata]